MANRTLGTITTMLTLNNSAFKKGLGNSKKDVNKFSKGIGKLGGLMAGTFAASRIIGFTREASKLAATVEGVQVAFDRIRPSISFLEELKDATAGTVSELDLMRRSVMASNFKIPLTELSSLLKFATKRAQETGESVSYLVNSIVIGIGRKSPLILDNLGISAVELREKLENVGHSGATVGDVAKAVGEIATEAMKQMGDVLETTAIKQERLNATITDMKVEFGNAANVIISRAVPAITAFIEELSVLGRFMKTFWEGGNVFTGEWERQMGQDILNSAGRGFATLRKAIEFESKKLADSGMNPKEAILAEISKAQKKALIDLFQASSPEWEAVARDTIKRLNKWKKEILKFGLDGEGGLLNIENLKAERDALILIQNKLEETDPQLAKVNTRLTEIEETIKRIKAVGTPLPDVLVPNNLNTEDYVLPDGFMDIDTGTETWIESLRRRREEMERFRDSLKETGVDAEDIGTQIGMTMVNSLDSLGEAFARLKMGAEGALNDLGELLLKNLGNILMMVGMSTSPIGWGLVAAGAALQFGSGILSGLGSSAPSGQGANSSGTVDFRISGNDLVGALQRNNVRNSLVT